MSEPVDREKIRERPMLDLTGGIHGVPRSGILVTTDELDSLLVELEQAEMEAHNFRTIIGDLESRLAQAEADRDEARRIAGHWSRKLNEAEKERDEALGALGLDVGP